MAIAAPLRRAFDYEYEASMAPRLVPGVRVRVPFGRRDVVGVVLAAPREESGAGYAYRQVREVLDAPGAPLLDAELLRLCLWAADYYQHPVGEVLTAAVPPLLRSGAALSEPARAPRWRLTERGAATRATLPARSKNLHALLALLEDAPLTAADVLERLGSAVRPSLRRARAEGWIEEQLPSLDDSMPMDPPAFPAVSQAPPPTSGQSAALQRLREAAAGYSATVLEGVTGSGKTEVYLQRTADVLGDAGQVLVLTPEIGLTPQLLERYARRFGDRVAAYHSGLSERERARAWMRMREGRVDVVVGTRSAVFAPLPRLRLIVVDEEHDLSYKQQEGFRYSARDLALMRARQLGIPVILGTATPALETLHNALTARYAHVELPQRVHGTALPRIRPLDLRAQKLEAGLSVPLLEAVERHLSEGGQGLLFLNRRGFAPVLQCHACGWTAPCPNCDARLVWHRREARLRCHHCGFAEAVPRVCPDCGQLRLMPLGQGTERIEDVLRLRFPQARIERFDSDRLARAGESERLHRQAHAGEIDLLVGTQVLAKGHDFPRLSFAGIVDADGALYGSDFRAVERMGQLLTQVAGRVGRLGQAGEVLLQTHHPEHPLLQRLMRDGYRRFCADLLDERRQAALPPFTHLALIQAQAVHEAPALEFLRALRPAAVAENVEVLGPAPATMRRRAGVHRVQLLLRSASRTALHRALRQWIAAAEAAPASGGVRWSLDVDPLEVF